MTTKEKAFGLAKAAATVAAPELAVPIEVVGKLLDRRSAPAPPAARAPGPQQLAENVIFVPPDENPKLIRWGKDRIRVHRRGDLRIVTVERVRGISAVEAALIALAAGTAYGLYELDQYLISKGQKQTNALGIPFSNWLPGGGSNPLNYALP